MSFWKRQYENAIANKASNVSALSSPSDTRRKKEPLEPLPSPSQLRAMNSVGSWKTHLPADIPEDESLKAPLSEDMADILSPSDDSSRPYNGEGKEDYMIALSASTCSADSIIRRVEEEIAAAKKAAATAKNRITEGEVSTPKSKVASPSSASSSGDEPSVDMRDILSTSTALEEEEEGEEEDVGDEASNMRYVDIGRNNPKLMVRVHRQQAPVGRRHRAALVDYLSDEVSEDPGASQSNQEKEAPVDVDERRTETRGGRTVKANPVQTDPGNILTINRSMLDKLEETGPDESSMTSPLAHSVGPDVLSPRSEAEAGNRARAILDTLKERREYYSTQFRSHMTTPAPQPPQPAEEIEPVPKNDDRDIETPDHVQAVDGEKRPPLRVSTTHLSEAEEEKKEDSLPVEASAAPLSPVSPTRDDEGGSPRGKQSRKTTDQEANTTDEKPSTGEDALVKKSRRVRFRDPFPVVKPENRPRDAASIIADHKIGTPKMPIRWLRPKDEVRQLIVAIIGSSLARRSNACGAMKVITRQKKNQLTLTRTDSFLEAIVFAASQDLSHEEVDLAIDARTRAIACLRNVSEPKDNRILIMQHPGVKECLLKVLREDGGEARMLSCASVALFAKMPECREALAETEGLVDALADILKGDMETKESIDESDRDGKGALNIDLLSEISSSEVVPAESDVYSGSSMSRTSTEREDGETGDESSESASYSGSGSDSEEDSDDEQKKADGKMGSKIQIRKHCSIRRKNEEMMGEFEQRSRSNACAALLHLSKHCAVSQMLCSSAILMDALVSVAQEYDNTVHTKCLEIISNLSRFPPNTCNMARFSGLVDTLVDAAESSLSEDRVCALRALQNISADSSSKTLLATDGLLVAMSTCALRKAPDEKEAAVSLLYNISTEPGAVVAITNTRNVIATLVHLAHHPDSASHIRLMTCDALASVSLWLQTLAGTGKTPKDTPNAPLPSLKASGWERWE